MKKTSLYIITGVNGTGKSTMVPLLKKMLPGVFKVFDFDQRGVPENVDKRWRLATTKYWLRVAKKNEKKKIITVMCGLAIPSEIYKSKQELKGPTVAIALLDTSASQIRIRLKKRFSTKAKIRNLKKVTGLTIAECIAANIAHAKLLRKEAQRYHCVRFNTSRTMPMRTAKKITLWIQR